MNHLVLIISLLNSESRNYFTSMVIFLISGDIVKYINNNNNMKFFQQKKLFVKCLQE